MRTLLGHLRATGTTRWLTTFGLVGLVAGIWALTTPLFAGPDETAHVIRAAGLVRGDVVGTTREGEPEFVRYVEVPAIFESVTIPFIGNPDLSTVCFAFDRNATADCLSFSGPQERAEVPTQVALYPPAYYGMAGAASLGLASVSGVLLMRAATVLVCAALVAWAVWSVRRTSEPRAALLGVAVALTPMTLFLFGVVNPNSIEIAAGIALWAAAGALVLEAPKQVDGRLVAVAGGAAIALTLSRGLSPLWVALIALTLAVFAPPGAVRRLARDRTCRIWGTVVVIAGAAQVAWIVAFEPLDNIVGSPVDGSTGEIVRASLGKSGWSYEQMIGIFGWLDTPAPFLTVVVWTGMLGGLVVFALAVGRRRERVALLGLIAAVVAVPVMLESARAEAVGLVWQGRYAMPFAVGVPILAGLIVATDEPRAFSHARTRLWVVAIAALFVAHLLAYVQHLRRYMVGYDGPLLFWRDPDWSPLLPAWVLVPAYALALAGLLRWLLAPASAERAVEPSASR